MEATNMAYQGLSLGDIAAQAGAIKAQQQRGTLADFAIQQQQREQSQQQQIDDASRLQNPTLADYATAGAAGVQAFGERQKVQTQLTQQDQLKHLASSAVVANSKNPKATAQQYAPELIASFEQLNGPGSFNNLTDDQVKTAATDIHDHLLGLLTPPETQFKEGAQDARNKYSVEHEDTRAANTVSATIRGQNLTDTRDRQGQVYTNRRAGLNDDGTSTFGTGAASNLSGDAFLGTLPPAQQAQVKALADGRMQFPGGFALKSPYWQQMLSAVSQYDPSFDGVNFNARASTRKDFTSGKSAQNIKSLNTAIGHLGALDSQIGGTASHSFTPLNAAENYLSSTLGGDAGPTRFSQTAGALASELTAVFRGSGGAEADVKRYLAELNPNASLEQKKAAVQNITELLSSRLAAIGDQYNKGLGRTEDPLSLLDPKAAGVLQRIQGGSGDTAANASAQTGNAPVKVSSPAEAMQLPPGTQFVTPDGRVKVR
jgi:hypothetical protein